MIIYVAGNPDAYPFEYYNPDTQAYEGVIPELLQEFAQQSGYEIIYYQADGKDHREHLAKMNQVDIVSGYKKEDITEGNEKVMLFSAAMENEEYAYCLYFTQAAPLQFKEDLQKYFDGIAQEEMMGILLDVATMPQTNNTSFTAIISLSLIVVLLLTTIGVLIRKYRKKLSLAQQNLETDELTGLGNMDYLLKYYKQFVNDKNRILYQLFYFYVDTEHLLKISSSKETDEFLRYCAVVLQENTNDTDILAKVSDHGFVMVKLETDAKQAENWINQVSERICSYSVIYAKPFETELGIGYYALKQQDWDLNEIIFNVSQCAASAIRENQSYIYYSDQIKNKLIQEKQLQAEIDRAFAKREFELYIQFYVDAYSSRIVGGEALSRWNHPQKGVLLPNEFVPLMEHEKLIPKLDYYCLNEVCIFLQNLFENKIEHFFISCNFSRETFAAIDFVEKTKQLMNQFTFPRELLIFEITESMTVKNTEQITKNILLLKEYGVRVALDDFGEGFTSFYDLHKYPIDGIKLDKGLIDHMMSTSGYAIIKAMIQVGHELAMTVLAEGVETEAQVQMLKQLQCDVIQGYYFYFPLPEWEARKKIMENYSSH